MNNSELEKIDRYVLGEMDIAERESFLQLINSDQELAEKVQLQEEAYAILDEIGDQKMKTKLNEIHNNMKKVAKPRFSTSIKVSFLIGLFLLTGLAYYFFVYTPNKIPQPDLIYAQYFEAYPVKLASRGIEDSASLKLQQINALYKNKKYKVALPIIESLIGKSTDTKLQLAAGISALELGVFDTAMNHFNLLIDTKDPLYQDQAQWYAALTALKMGKPNLTKDYLQLLIESGSNYKQSESKAILKTLK